MHGRGGEPSRVGKLARSARRTSARPVHPNRNRSGPANSPLGAGEAANHEGLALDTPCVPATLGEPEIPRGDTL